jgi:hypothetical protein
MESKNASNIELIGFKTLMCFTKERFQRMRRRKVLMRITSVKRRTSVSMSDFVSVLEISLSIYY